MSKEKQIEEITELLWHFPKAFYSNCYDNCEEIAKLLYEEGYRKQSVGVWIKPSMYSEHICSNCGRSPKIFYGLLSPYCPNCGAKMKGE